MKDFADEFVDLACLCYDDPHFDHRSFHVRAHDMLQKSPELAESNIWSAASAGNAAAVRSFLDKSPDLVNQPGGPHSWVPLICACYSRVQPVDSEHSTFQVAKLLLDRGADPKPIPPSTMTLQAVTAGAASLRWRACSGGGSTGMANQPAHPHWREFAELLLERGADPADDQALHINQSASLPVLLRYGLRPDARTRAADSFITLMGRELCQAARQGRTDMMKLLLVHNARTDEMSDGKTPWQHAMEHGHLELDLGFDPDWMDENAALHSAAGEGNEEMVRLLIGRGASLTLRDPWYDGTPI